MFACRPSGASLERDFEPPPLPDRRVAALTDLLTPVGLEWLVLLRPRELFGQAWLRPALARILKDERLEALAQATGVDLRNLADLALASYRKPGDEPATLYLIRHEANPVELERKFRDRLTSDTTRKQFGHQLIGVWGLVGRTERGFIAAGPHVVGFEYGGDRKRGPGRIALLHAEQRLASLPTVTTDETLVSLMRSVGESPARAFLVGPFEGSMARGARGLLGGATGVGVSLAPTASRTVALTLVLSGEFSDPTAVGFLEGAFSDLATSDLGHLLGLGSLPAPVRVRSVPDGLELRVELDPMTLLDGLAAATTEDVRSILR